jgi:hypothetical protein
MVVKVIKPAPPEAAHEQMCAHCHVTLQFLNADIYTHFQEDRGGGGTTYYMIHCPECNYLTNIKIQPRLDKKFPGRIESDFGYLTPYKD